MSKLFTSILTIIVTVDLVCITCVYKSDCDDEERAQYMRPCSSWSQESFI